MLALGEWRPKLVLFLLLLFPFQTPAEIKSWRVGDQDHPWNLIPVSGRLTWGRGWAVEILTNDDGDGLIDEDGRRLRDTGGVSTWLRPIELNERRNLAILLNERYLQGEFGGVGPDGK